MLIQSSGTVRAKAIILDSVAIFSCNRALRGSPVSAAILKSGHELVTGLGQQLDAVGSQQLVIAESGRDGVRIRCVVLEARLHVVLTIAARLEAVDLHRLLFGKSRSGRSSHVRSLVIDFGRRSVRDKIEFFLGGVKEDGDDRDWLGCGGLRCASSFTGLIGFGGPEYTGGCVNT